MAISSQLRSYRPSRSYSEYPVRKRTPDHLGDPVVTQPAPLSPPNVAGNAAELDEKPAFAEQLQATWDLIETGAYTNEEDDAVTLDAPHSQEGNLKTVNIELNGVLVELPDGHLITLEALGVGRSNFLYLNDLFVPMSRAGIPMKDLKAEDGMKFQTKAYPAMQPVASLYWACMHVLPSRTSISSFLQSPWGRTIVNALNALLMALMARPGINASSAPVQIIISVVSGARMLDLMIKDTILALLRDGRLTMSHALFALVVCETCLVIGASIPIGCVRLVEYHLMPVLFIVWTLGAPLVHNFWIITGQATKGRGYKGLVLGQILWCLPVLAFLTILIGDFIFRSNLEVKSLLTCEIVDVVGIGPRSKLSQSDNQGERVML